MDEFINNLDKNLRYENHEFNGEIYYIYVKSTRKKVNCTKCGQAYPEFIALILEVSRIYQYKIKR